MDEHAPTFHDVSMVSTPIIRTFGIRYLRSGPGWLEAEFEPDERFANHSGYVQGGVLAVYLDNIMGQSCYTLVGPEQVLSTTEMTLHFLEPALLGPLKGTARVVKRGRQMLFVEGEVQDARGKALARAVGSMLVLRRTRAEAARPAGHEPSGEGEG